MDEGNSTIYGLEHQARALAPQLAESYAVRFLIGTQSLKANSNQVHVVELEEDTGALHTKVFGHGFGEVWHLRCSPLNASLLTTCHSSCGQDGAPVRQGVSLLRLPYTQVLPDPDLPSPQHAEQLEVVTDFHVEKYGQDIRCAEFHLTEGSRLAVVVDNSVVLLEADGREVSHVQLQGKGHLKFSGGKWNPHQNAHQFTALQDTHVRSYDTRSSGAHAAWSLEAAHAQHLRDLDFNPNRQFHLATAADDGFLKLWDYRNPREPVFTRSDHSHWIWAVRFNTFHDQLILTSSSDARVLLTCAASVSSEAGQAHILADSCEEEEETSKAQDGDSRDNKVKDNASQGDVSQVNEDETKAKLEDGPLQWYEQHEDSVYCVEWSSADPWTFASLSYDGRLVLSKVPKQHKYNILL